MKNKMKKHEKLMRIKLLNYAIFGEFKKENFNKNEVEKLKQTPLNKVREELRKISDSYLDELYDKCEKKSKSPLDMPIPNLSFALPQNCILFGEGSPALSYTFANTSCVTGVAPIAPPLNVVTSSISAVPVECKWPSE